MKYELNKIYNMDCLEFMRDVPDKYFDLVFTDIPYNVSKDYGVYKDNLSDNDYLSWLKLVIDELKRISQSQIIYPSKKYFIETWNMLGKEYQQIVFTTSTSGAIRYGHANQFTSLLVNEKPNNIVPNHYHNIPMPHDGFMFKEEKFGHAGYTSNALIELMLRNYAKEGFKIYDPFGGTGSLAVVCRHLNSFNFEWCMTELEPDYVAIANKRLEAVQGSLF